MSRRNEIVTGIFVLVGVGLIVSGALWLSEAGWRGEFRSVEAQFTDVGQLKPGNNVTLRGVQVGRVASIELAEEGVVVTLQIRAGARLPEDPVVVLHPLSLFGEWGASIEPASEHPGLERDTLALARGRLAGVASTDFARLSEHAQVIASNLETITDRIELAFDEETARNLARAVDNFEQASDELVALMSRQRESFGGFAEDLASAGSTLRESAADLDSIMSRLERATARGQLQAIFDNSREVTASLKGVSSELETATGDMRGAVARADTALGQAESILARINRGEGSLGRITNDPVLYEDLLATLTELRSLLDDLKSNPDKYFKFSIF